VEFFHQALLGGYQVGHLPTRISRISKQTEYLQERRDEGVVEIHHHLDFIAGSTGIFRG
jgi:hypothetical protein